jgi:hypothetical protein
MLTDGSRLYTLTHHTYTQQAQLSTSYLVSIMEVFKYI